MCVRRVTGLSTWQLRQYANSGLVGPVDRTEGGHRLYSREQVALLVRIADWRRQGFEVREIRALLAKDASAAGRYFARRKEKLEQAIALVDAFEREMAALDGEAQVGCSGGRVRSAHALRATDNFT